MIARSSNHHVLCAYHTTSHTRQRSANHRVHRETEQWNHFFGALAGTWCVGVSGSGWRGRRLKTPAWGCRADVAVGILGREDLLVHRRPSTATVKRGCVIWIDGGGFVSWWVCDDLAGFSVDLVEIRRFSRYWDGVIHGGALVPIYFLIFFGYTWRFSRFTLKLSGIFIVHQEPRFQLNYPKFSGKFYISYLPILNQWYHSYLF